MGRTLEVDWQETASELKKQYRKERNSERKTRLQAFWQLRLGKTLKEVVELIGISYRTLQRWIAWYRQGGLKEVLRRIKGHGNQGRPTKLNAIQQKALAAKTALGSFRNIWDAIQWVPDAVIWDGASAHRGKAMGEVGFDRIFLLPYSPELNPCERVFEWLRANIEGEVYKSLHHKRHTIEQHLRWLRRDTSRLKHLISWKWIQEAFTQLTAASTPEILH